MLGCKHSAPSHAVCNRQTLYFLYHLPESRKCSKFILCVPFCWLQFELHVIAGTTSCTDSLNGEYGNPIAGVLLSRTIPTKPSTCHSHLLYHVGAPLVSCKSPCQPYCHLHIYLSFISSPCRSLDFGLIFWVFTTCRMVQSHQML